MRSNSGGGTPSAKKTWMRRVSAGLVFHGVAKARSLLVSPVTLDLKWVCLATVPSSASTIREAFEEIGEIESVRLSTEMEVRACSGWLRCREPL